MMCCMKELVFGRKIFRSFRVHLIVFAGCLLQLAMESGWQAGGPLRCGGVQMSEWCYGNSAVDLFFLLLPHGRIIVRARRRSAEDPGDPTLF